MNRGGWEAMRAFRLNLKRWAEDHPVVVGVILAAGTFFGLLALAHGCEMKAVAVPLVEGPREAPAGPPAVPPVGPGGRRFWRATIHHTATSANNPAERVRAIDADHRSRGWDGIGYHFLVAEDGTVFSGRPLDRQGAHVRGENEGNLGIALIGNYTDRPPPEAALAFVRRLLATWGFGPDAVYFHRDLAATECPGPWDQGVLF